MVKVCQTLKFMVIWLFSAMEHIVTVWLPNQFPELNFQLRYTTSHIIESLISATFSYIVKLYYKN